jgi:hypothetical protein
MYENSMPLKVASARSDVVADLRGRGTSASRSTSYQADHQPSLSEAGAARRHGGSANLRQDGRVRRETATTCWAFLGPTGPNGVSW